MYFRFDCPELVKMPSARACADCKAQGWDRPFAGTLMFPCRQHRQLHQAVKLAWMVLLL